MKKQISIYEHGQAYLGKDAEEDGYKGKTDAYFNTVTIAIVRPGSSLKEIKRSLEMTLEDIEIRLLQEKSS
jgi:hypothetical protein